MDGCRVGVIAPSAFVTDVADGAPKARPDVQKDDLMVRMYVPSLLGFAMSRPAPR
jgi:hypothetical protein